MSPRRRNTATAVPPSPVVLKAPHTPSLHATAEDLDGVLSITPLTPAVLGSGRSTTAAAAATTAPASRRGPCPGTPRSRMQRASPWSASSPSAAPLCFSPARLNNLQRQLQMCANSDEDEEVSMEQPAFAVFAPAPAGRTPVSLRAQREVGAGFGTGAGGVGGGSHAAATVDTAARAGAELAQSCFGAVPSYFGAQSPRVPIGTVATKTVGAPAFVFPPPAASASVSAAMPPAAFGSTSTSTPSFMPPPPVPRSMPFASPLRPPVFAQSHNLRAGRPALAPPPAPVLVTPEELALDSVDPLDWQPPGRLALPLALGLPHAAGSSSV